MTTNAARDKVKERFNRSHLGDTSNRSEVKSSVYLFLSLDLVNSTEFKSKCEGWPGLLNVFYDRANHEIKKIDDVRLWKFVGDEVLFYKQVKSVNDLETALLQALFAVRTVTTLVQNAQAADESAKHAPLLSVKGTAWIGKATMMPNQMDWNAFEAIHRNLVLTVPGQKNAPLKDFLGPDIDTGFRVSKYAHSNLIAVSAELARVILKKGSTTISEMLRIVGYEQLKGVWGNRHYPIVWFSDKWKTLSEVFQYDERFTSLLVKAAIDQAEKQLSSDELDQAFKDVRQIEFNQQLLGMIDVDASPDEELIDEDPEVIQVEVHCVAVCFNANGKVLAAKRPAEKLVMPNKWEFGCAKLMPSGDFFDAMTTHYQTDFGAALDFPSRDPVATYFIQERKVPGVIFVADVTNWEQVNDANWQAKHTELNWVDPLNPEIQPEDCVPEFHETLKKAHDVWSKVKR